MDLNPLAGSALGNLCLDRFLDPAEVGQPDIVFSEYLLNDGYVDTQMIHLNPVTASNERLIRRLLSYPQQPAVVVMMVTMPQQVSVSQQNNKIT